MAFPIFNFLKLPFLAQERLVEQLELENVILLALQNRRFKRIMKFINIKIDVFTWHFDLAYSIKLERDCYEMEFEIISSDCGKGNVDPKSIEFEKTDDKIQMYQKLNVPREELMKHLTYSLLDFISVKEFDFLQFRAVNFDLWNCFVWGITKKFDVFSYSPCHNFDAFKKVSECIFMQNELEIHDLKLYFPNNKHTITYTHPLKGDIVKVKDSEFIHFDCLLNAQCRMLFLCRTKIESSDMNSFIWKWMNGGLANLSVFNAEIKDKTVSHDKEKIFEGIDVLPTMKGPHPLQPCSDETWLNMALDFYRASDNKRASVIITNDAFRFFVWN